MYGTPSKKLVKGGSETGWTQGIMFDEVTGRLYYSFGSWYNIPNTNDPALAWAELNTSGPIPHGPWQAPDGVSHAQRIRGGSLIIPDWFANAYLGGRNLGLGFGAYYSGYQAARRGRTWRRRTTRKTPIRF